MSFSMTDGVYLLILAILSLYLLLSFRNPITREIWAGMLTRPVAIVSFLVIFFFISISVLDSIRLQDEASQSVESMTILDRLLSPLGEVQEQSYSAPFALHLYSKDLKWTPEGIVQTYPRLTYPKSSLKTPDDVWQFTKSALLKSTAIALLFCAIAFFMYLLVQGFCVREEGRLNGVRWAKSILSPRHKKALISLLLIVFVLVFITGTLYLLSRSLHVFGTGKVGEDLFYYSVKSIRTGLVIGVVTTLVTLPFAVGLGVMAGYFGGVVDDVIQYLYTTLSSVPGVLLITASVLAFETYITNHPHLFGDLAMIADARLLALCLILGLTSWTSLCRLVRAETMKLREMDFVMAAKVLGSRKRFILLRHMIPNLMHLVILTIVLDFSQLVLAEAVLSYIGVGVSPMTMSWGNMINAARLELAREPIVYWPVICAFVMMFTLVLACNLFAEAMREAYDPREAG